MVDLHFQSQVLSLKDGDLVVVRSEDPERLDQAVDTFLRQPGAPKVFFWFLSPGESLEVLTNTDRDALREALDG